VSCFAFSHKVPKWNKRFVFLAYRLRPTLALVCANKSVYYALASLRDSTEPGLSRALALDCHVLFLRSFMFEPTLACWESREHESVCFHRGSSRQLLVNPTGIEEFGKREVPAASLGSLGSCSWIG